MRRPRRATTPSAAAWPATRCAARSTCRFGPTLDETLDIFPAARPGAPVFVFVHGGYWRAITARSSAASRSGRVPPGITTVVINYALCPKVTIDEITRQVRAAIAWVLKHIDAHGGDPARVAVGGHSAGGHLSAMACRPLGRRLRPARRPARRGGAGQRHLRPGPLRYSYLQPMIQLDDGVIRRQSPLFACARARTPALITWGADEAREFARQSRVYHEAWQAAGNRSELVPVPGANHFGAIHGFEDPVECDSAAGSPRPCNAAAADTRGEQQWPKTRPHATDRRCMRRHRSG